MKFPVWKVLLFASAILFVIAGLKATFLYRIPDDSYIYFRYVYHFFEGHGLVYNIGERVEGISSLTWTFLLILFAYAIPEKIIVISRFLGIACSLVTLLFMLRCIKITLYRGYLFLICGSLVVIGLTFDTSFQRWTVAGLESPLYILLVLAAFYHVLKRLDSKDHLTYNDWYLHLLFYFLSITRTEGIFYYLFYCAFVYLSNRLEGKSSLGNKFLRNSILFFVIPFIGILIFRLSYYHDFLPNSVWAKGIGGYSVEALRHGCKYVLSFFHFPMMAIPFIILLLAFFAQNVILLKSIRYKTAKIEKSLYEGARPQGYLLSHYLTTRNGYLFSLVLLVFCSGPILVAIRNGGDWMSHHRLLLQTRVFLLFYSAYLLGLMLDTITFRFSFFKKKAVSRGIEYLALSCILMTIACQAAWNISLPTIWNRYDNTEDQIANWISLVKQHNSERHLVIVTEVGGRVPFYSLDTYFIEYFGLTDKVIAKTGHVSFPMGKVHNRYVNNRNPDILIFNNPTRAQKLFDGVLDGASRYYFVILPRINNVCLVKTELENSIELSKNLSQRFDGNFEIPYGPAAPAPDLSRRRDAFSRSRGSRRPRHSPSAPRSFR